MPKADSTSAVASKKPVDSHGEVEGTGALRSETGRRARRREELRDRVYEAAIASFVEQGFATTTMDAIAERADVARGTVFNHFPQKVAFLEEWGRRRRAHVARTVEADRQEDGSAAAQLRHYLCEMAMLNVKSREQTIVLMDAAARFGALLRDTSLAAALAELVNLGQQRDEFRSNVAPEQVGALLSSVYFSTILRWIADDPPPFDLGSQLEAMLNIVLEGLLTRTGT